MAIRVICDSTAYLSEEILKKYNINVISVNVVLDNESYREVELENKTFYDMMNESKDFPKSAQPAMTEMLEKFEEPLKQGDDLLIIAMSSDLSGTFSTCNLIKNELLEKYPDRIIEVVDSKTTCMEMGLRVIECAKAAQSGASMDDVLKIGEEVAKTSEFYFTPSSLDYLRKGGRIGAAGALLGGILKIRPILKVLDGKVAVVEKVRTQAKAIVEIVNIFKKDAENKEVGGLVIHHINCIDEAKKLADAIKSELNIETMIIDIGPVIGVHVGPGAIGIAYYTK